MRRVTVLPLPTGQGLRGRKERGDEIGRHRDEIQRQASRFEANRLSIGSLIYSWSTLRGGADDGCRVPSNSVAFAKRSPTTPTRPRGLRAGRLLGMVEHHVALPQYGRKGVTHGTDPGRRRVSLSQRLRTLATFVGMAMLALATPSMPADNAQAPRLVLTRERLANLRAEAQTNPEVTRAAGSCCGRLSVCSPSRH